MSCLDCRLTKRSWLGGLYCLYPATKRKWSLEFWCPLLTKWTEQVRMPTAWKQKPKFLWKLFLLLPFRWRSGRGNNPYRDDAGRHSGRRPPRRPQISASEGENGAASLLRPQDASGLWRLCGHELWDRYACLPLDRPPTLNLQLDHEHETNIHFFLFRRRQNHPSTRPQWLRGWSETQSGLHQHPGWEWPAHQCASSLPGTVSDH